MDNYYSKNIVYLRNQKGLTAEMMAKLVDVSEEDYVSYEIGEKEPDMSTNIKIAKVFGVEVVDLIQTDMVKPSKHKADKDDAVKVNKVKVAYNQHHNFVVKKSIAMVCAILAFISMFISICEVDVGSTISGLLPEGMVNTKVGYTFIDTINFSSFSIVSCMNLIVVLAIIYCIVNAIIMLASKTLRASVYGKISSTIEMGLSIYVLMVVANTIIPIIRTMFSSGGIGIGISLFSLPIAVVVLLFVQTNLLAGNVRAEQVVYANEHTYDNVKYNKYSLFGVLRVVSICMCVLMMIFASCECASVSLSAIGVTTSFDVTFYSLLSFENISIYTLMYWIIFLGMHYIVVEDILMLASTKLRYSKYGFFSAMIKLIVVSVVLVLWLIAIMLQDGVTLLFGAYSVLVVLAILVAISIVLLITREKQNVAKSKEEDFDVVKTPKIKLPPMYKTHWMISIIKLLSIGLMMSMLPYIFCDHIGLLIFMISYMCFLVYYIVETIMSMVMRCIISGKIFSVVDVVLNVIGFLYLLSCPIWIFACEPQSIGEFGYYNASTILIIVLLALVIFMMNMYKRLILNNPNKTYAKLSVKSKIFLGVSIVLSIVLLCCVFMDSYIDSSWGAENLTFYKTHNILAFIVMLVVYNIFEYGIEFMIGRYIKSMPFAMVAFAINTAICVISYSMLLFISAELEVLVTMYIIYIVMLLLFIMGFIHMLARIHAKHTAIE